MQEKSKDINKSPFHTKTIKRTKLVQLSSFGESCIQFSKTKKLIPERIQTNCHTLDSKLKIKKPVYSSHSFGYIQSFGVNSFKGYHKKFNEDRVSAIINITNPKNSKKKWPNHLSYFGLFDGHGGNKCCNFLVDNFHHFLINSQFFPTEIDKALCDAFLTSEEIFLNNHAIGKNNELLNQSGSCGLVIVIADKVCYIANVGDSRAILSTSNGKEVFQLTNDHKPNYKKEKKRIIKNGGVVYKASSFQSIYRVLPGNLSVSRTIGDAEAKKSVYGGKEGVVIPTPEITKIVIDENKFDFIILGSDGIFDKTDNTDLVKGIFNFIKSQRNKEDDINRISGKCTNFVIKMALKNNSQDNLSSIFISFPLFEKFINSPQK